MKCTLFKIKINSHSSPSMRREWIEMEVLKMKIEVGKVSLHAEGVD